MKPLIGITASQAFEQSRDGFLGYPRHYLSFDYTEAVIRAGGIPVILPILTEQAGAADMVARMDGLILSGGSDVSPLVFGEEPREKLGNTSILRDRSEIWILDEAARIELPVLGICRGFQLLNCYFGGSLYQDLSEAEHLHIKHAFESLPGDPAHSITTAEGSLIRELLGAKELVNSHHHQVLDRIADRFRVTAQAPDGAAEAIEPVSGEPFMLGVQFHPEMMVRTYPQFLSIFTKFIDESKQFRDA